MARSVEQLKSDLLKAELVEDSQLKSLDSDADTVHDFADTLVERGLVTRFQASRLLAGEGHTLTLGRYVLLDTIGAGGMGQVFLARHRTMNREVALKVLPPKLTRDAQAIARFAREVEAAARLTHANIVRAHDASESDGVHYLVMEYVAGQDLSSLVKANGPLPIDEAVDFVIQTAHGLQYAHDQGVMHRDIKPANLLLSDEGVVKILDMGLARFEQEGDASLTRTGVVMGTIDYMSPEQALDTRSADARADVYSLGCTLHYLLTGQPVFAGDTSMKKLLAHRESPVPSLRERCPQASEALDTVFQRMLAKQPDERLQTMQDVINLLQQCRDGVTEASRLNLTAAESDSQRTPEPQTTDDVDAESEPRRSRSTLLWVGGGIAALVVAGILALAFSGGEDDESSSAGERQAGSNSTAAADTDRGDAKPSDTPGSESQPPSIVLPQVTVADPIPSAVNGILPGTAREPLPGLLAGPASRAKVRRWELVLRDSQRSVTCASWNKAGTRVAVGSEDGNVRVYDAATWKLNCVLPVSLQQVESIDWALDGRLATGARDVLKVWSVDGNHEDRMRCNVTVKAHGEGLIRGVRWSPDGNWLATHGHTDQRVRIWDSSLSLTATLLPGRVIPNNAFNNALLDFSWSPDSQSLVVTDHHNHGVAIISRTDETSARLIDGVKGGAVSWHPTDDLIGTAAQGEVILFRSDGTVVSRVKLDRGSGGQGTSFWSPDGRVFATSCGGIHLVTADGDSSQVDFGKIRDGGSALCWSPDSNQLIRAGNYATLQCTTIGTEERVDIVPFTNRGAAISLSWQPRQDALSVGSAKGIVHHWKLAEQTVDSFRAGGAELAVAWSPDATRLACGHCINGSGLKLFNEDFEPVGDVSGVVQVSDLEWDASSQLLAASDKNRGVIRLIGRDGSIKQELQLQERGVALTWHTEKPEFVVVGQSFREWRDFDGNLLKHFTDPESSQYTDVACSADGQSILTAGRSAQATVWPPSESPHAVIGPNTYGYAVSVNPVDGRVASVSMLNGIHSVVTIWSPDGNPLQEIPAGQVSSVGLAWNFKGTRLGIVSLEGTVQVWSGTPLRHTSTMILNRDGESFLVDSEGVPLDSTNRATFDESFRYVAEQTDGVAVTQRSEEFFTSLRERTQDADGSESSPGMKVVATISPDSTSTWVAKDDWQLVPNSLYRGVRFLAWNPGKLIACGTLGGELALLDGDTLQLKQRLPFVPGEVTAAAWSPDGEALACGTSSGHTFVYRLDGSWHRFPTLHSAAIIHIVWNGAGTHFCTACADGSPDHLVWDAQSQTSIRLTGHARGIHGVNSIGWHPKKLWIASCTAGKLLVWDASDGSRLAEHEVSNVASIDWKPDSDELYLWGQNIHPQTSCLIYNLGTDTTIPSPGWPPMGKIITARLSSDGEKVAVGSQDNPFRLMAKDGTELYRSDDKRGWNAWYSWNGDSTKAAYSPGTESIRIGDITGNMIAEIQTSHIESNVCWSADGRFLATAGTDDCIRRWSADGSTVALMNGHTEHVRSVSWSPTDPALASLGNDGKLMLWNEAGEKSAEYDGFLIRHDVEGRLASRDLAWHPSGKLIAAAGAASTLKIVNLESGEIHSSSMLGPILSLAWNRAGTQLAIGCEPNLVVFWEPGQTDPRFLTVKTRPDAIEWHSDDEVIVAGETAWRVPTDGSQATAFINNTGVEAEIRMSPDHRWLVLAGDEVELFAPDGTPEATFANQDSVTVSVAWSPDGTRIASTYNDGGLRVWDVATGNVRWRGLPTATGQAVTFSASGDLLNGDPRGLDATHKIIRHTDNERLEVVLPSQFLQPAEYPDESLFPSTADTAASQTTSANTQTTDN